VDGEIHQYTKKEDLVRHEFLETNNFRVIHFTNESVLNNIDGIIKQISLYLTTSQ
jgi:very-short-patch-repair endonuclease